MCARRHSVLEDSVLPPTDELARLYTVRVRDRKPKEKHSKAQGNLGCPARNNRKKQKAHRQNKTCWGLRSCTEGRPSWGKLWGKEQEEEGTKTRGTHPSQRGRGADTQHKPEPKGRGEDTQTPPSQRAGTKTRSTPHICEELGDSKMAPSFALCVLFFSLQNHGESHARAVAQIFKGAPMSRR